MSTKVIGAAGTAAAAPAVPLVPTAEPAVAPAVDETPDSGCAFMSMKLPSAPRWTHPVIEISRSAVSAARVAVVVAVPL